MDIDLKLEDGKYRVAYDLKNGVAQAFRNGEPWRDLIGDNLIHALASDLSEAQEREKALTAEISSLRAQLAAAKVSDKTDVVLPDSVDRVNAEMIVVAKACLDAELNRLQLLPPSSPAASYCRARVATLDREIKFANDALLDREFRSAWSVDMALYAALCVCQKAFRIRDTSTEDSPAKAAEYSDDLAIRLEDVIYRAKTLLNPQTEESAQQKAEQLVHEGSASPSA